MKKIAKILLPVLIIITIFAFRSVNENDRYFQIVKNLDIFATLFKEINAHYVDEINPNQLIKTGIDAMLNSLDPYTTYIPEDDIEDYMTMTTGEYGGIGALVDRKNGVNTVILPYEDSPASKAGLKIGDEILSINGISLADKPADEIGKLLKGQSNSEVDLLIKRYNQPKPFNVKVKRERITISSVPYFGMVTDDIGYIRLTEFTTKASKDVSNALKKLKNEGAKKIILDLRGNPGGLLDEAINVSNIFIPKGLEVVTTRGKLTSSIRKYESTSEALDQDIPLAVLTDNGSASASEIVSGVVQDYDRGVLIGRKTFGKGLVQQARPLSYNSQIKVTTAKYYIPSGRCIQAIDYSSRNPDGSVGKIADSLKSEFKTRNGRKVYDGGGVDPDLVVERFNFAPISMSLLTKDLIFYYATQYYYSNTDIGDPRKFSISDQEYDKFVKWLEDKDYDYSTKVEQTVNALIETAKIEKYYDEIKDQIYALKAATLHNKESDLSTFKSEIKALLEQEIASRYYLHKGALESTFDTDQDITAAVSVLNDIERYKKIINRQ